MGWVACYVSICGVQTSATYAMKYFLRHFILYRHTRLSGRTMVDMTVHFVGIVLIPHLERK